MQIKPYKIPHPFRKLTRELIDKILSDIGEGSTHRLATLSNGVTPRIFELWQAQGKVDVEHEQATLCAHLVRALSVIKQKEVIECRKAIKSNDKGHKGAEWTLEHAYWQDFGAHAEIKELENQIAQLRDQAQGDFGNGKETLDQRGDQTQGSPA